jgi:O-antigen/teichoic acid export membrane protein
LGNFLILLLITLLAYHAYAPVYVILCIPLPVALLGLVLVAKSSRPLEGVGGGRTLKSHREIFGIALPMLVTTSMQLVISQTDILMLGIMTRDTDVGVYHLAVRLLSVIQFVLISTNAVVAPRISEFYHKGRRAELQRLVKRVTRIAFFAAMMLTIGFILFGRILLGMFGGSFREGYTALVILAIGHFFNAASGPVGMFLNMTGHQKSIRNVVATAAALNFLFNLILIPRYGINGAAAAGMISMIFWNVAACVYVHRKFDFVIAYIPFVHRLSV